MNTDLNQEEYPRLVPPEVVYENKASLKKPALVPLYAKIISAAAAVALLVGIFWNRYSMPELEMTAELHPVGASRIEMGEPSILAESQARFIIPKRITKPAAAQQDEPVSYERTECPMVAELQPITAPMLTNSAYHPETLHDSDVYYAYVHTLWLDQEKGYDDGELSWVGRSIYQMTGGEHDSFAGIISEGLQSVKTGISSLAMTIQSSRSQLRQRVR